jgi:hypothetical protein
MPGVCPNLRARGEAKSAVGCYALFFVRSIGIYPGLSFAEGAEEKGIVSDGLLDELLEQE